MPFKFFLKESNCKPNKIWIDKGSEFYNRSMKSWLEKNYTKMYSTHNEGKPAVPETFIRTLQNRIYKYITSISKNVYTDKLDDVVNKYNNTYNSAIKVKPVYVKSKKYINSSKESNDEDPKFKIGDIDRISKLKNVFAKDCVPNWSEKAFVTKKVKNTTPWKYVIRDLNREEIVGTFH